MPKLKIAIIFNIFHFSTIIYINFVKMYYWAKVYIFISFLLGGYQLSIAQQRKCGYDNYYQIILKEYPEIVEKEIALQNELKNNNQRYAQSEGIIRIPVVIHVLYNTESQNISDEQIKSQISALNRDYRALNTDKLSSNHQFYDRIGDTEIEFCIATEDPWGQITTGIERKYVSKSSFSYSGNLNDADENYIKKSNKGGLDAWDTDKYLNIWIANFTDGTLGFASFPNDNAGIKDGIVIHYRVFGTIGNLLPDYNKGRTTTHEIGHWLGLKHIWGNGGNCNSDDGISDTPKQYDATYGCPSGIYDDECSPSTSGRMYQNFMDYTDDACMALFTKKQAEYVRNVLNSSRSSFLNNNIPCDFISKVTNNTLFKNIKVFPNPATNYLYIDQLPSSKEPYRIALYNELGQAVFTTTTNDYNTEIEVSELRKGVYYVEIVNGEHHYNQTVLVLH